MGRPSPRGGDDTSLRVWDCTARKPVAHLTGDRWSVNALSFSPNGKTLASAGSEGVVQLRDGETGRHVFTLSRNDPVLNFGGIDCLAFTPDGKTLAAVGTWDTTMQMWDVDTRKKTIALKLAVKKGHGRVMSVAFSPDGKTLATGGWDHTVRLWETASGTQTATLEAHAGAWWPWCLVRTDELWLRPDRSRIGP